MIKIGDVPDEMRYYIYMCAVVVILLDFIMLFMGISPIVMIFNIICLMCVVFVIQKKMHL